MLSRSDVYANFEKADVELLIEKLRRVYEEERRYVQLTLDGRVVVKPVPVLRAFGRVVRGVPVDDSRLRVLEPLPHRKPILAVDASVKVLFNLGSSKIIVSKAVALIYEGFERVEKMWVKRIGLVESKFQAGEWLLRVEFELALTALRKLRGGGYLLLDRSLLVPPILRPSTRGLVKRVERRAASSGVVLVGIPKTTRLSLDTGESFLGYLARVAERRMRGAAWYYYPIFKPDSLPAWVLGELAIVKFSELSDSVFRIDISKRSLLYRDCEEVLREIAFLQDLGVPGYPYPLKAVHEESRMNSNEVELDRLLLLEYLKREGLDTRVLVDSKSVSFKERCLWGEVP